MKLVVIPYEHTLGKATHQAIEMSYWCRDQGLEREKDYEWAFMQRNKEIHFRFFDHCESYATLFTLRWAGQ
jgi:hypothetical protein